MNPISDFLSKSEELQIMNKENAVIPKLISSSIALNIRFFVKGSPDLYDNKTDESMIASRLFKESFLCYFLFL